MLELKPKPISDVKPQEAKPESLEVFFFKQIKSKLRPLEIKAFEGLVLPFLKSRPQIGDFNYPDRDQDYLKLSKKQEQIRQKQVSEIEQINYMRSKIAEALLAEIIELYWLPGDFLTETSEYDDLLNGVDAVLETSTKAAVIDFTSARDKDIIRKKIFRIYDRIKANQLGEVKYFCSQKDGSQQYLKTLPAVIIGLDQKTIDELLNLRMSGKKKELEGHWSKYALVEELLSQIKSYKTYINNSFREGFNNQKADQMNMAYQELENTIINLKQKISLGAEMDGLIKKELFARDLVYQHIIGNSI